MVHHVQGVEGLQTEKYLIKYEDELKETVSMYVRVYVYLSHEDESSVEHHQQSVLIVLQQYTEGTGSTQRD